MEKINQLEGFFVEFTPEEINDVREELELQGYTADCAGIKEFIMDALFDEEVEQSDTERVINKARKFVNENPATVKFGLDTIAGLAKMVGQKTARR